MPSQDMYLYVKKQKFVEDLGIFWWKLPYKYRVLLDLSEQNNGARWNTGNSGKKPRINDVDLAVTVPKNVS